MFMVLLFACVLAHEFGHIFTARAFGVATPDVTLLPIGGVARLERIPEKPQRGIPDRHRRPAGERGDRAACWCVLPAPHLDPTTLAAVDKPSVSHGRPAGGGQSVPRVFNMIPAFPMDGGRVLRALLATRLGYRARHRDRGRDRPGRAPSCSASSACSTIRC